MPPQSNPSGLARKTSVKPLAGGSVSAAGAAPISNAASWQPKNDGMLLGDAPADAAQPKSGSSKTAAPTDKTVSTVLGEVTWLLTQSTQHKNLAIADLEWMLMPALLLRQFKLFYDTERNIQNPWVKNLGVVLFAKVSEAVAARLDAGGRLATLDDWRSGETVRVMATVAPFGGDVAL